MASSTVEKELPRYHPQFNSPYAEVVIISKEKTSYRVHQFTLRNTCGFFRSFFSGTSNPTFASLIHDSDRATSSNLSDEERRAGQGKKMGFEIEAEEKDDTLCRFLCMICGLPMTCETIDLVDDLIRLAQKWDAPGPLSILRSGITSPMFLADPLRMYAITAKMGWDDEMKLASTNTLPINLYDEAHIPDLERIPSIALLNLFRFHRSRRDNFKRVIDGQGISELGEILFEDKKYEAFPCGGCGEIKLAGPLWGEFKVRMFMEMDKRPMGDTICSLQVEEWFEAAACWSAKCKCGRPFFDKIATMRDIKKCIDNLQIHI